MGQSFMKPKVKGPCKAFKLFSNRSPKRPNEHQQSTRMRAVASFLRRLSSSGFFGTPQIFAANAAARPRSFGASIRRPSGRFGVGVPGFRRAPYTAAERPPVHCQCEPTRRQTRLSVQKNPLHAICFETEVVTPQGQTPCPRHRLLPLRIHQPAKPSRLSLGSWLRRNSRESRCFFGQNSDSRDVPAPPAGHPPQRLAGACFGCEARGAAATRGAPRSRVS